MLYEFHSSPSPYETTADDKNGLSSLSWLHSAQGDVVPSNLSSQQSRDENIGM